MGFIRDSIHGDLHLTDFELKIIDTVEMQRLRRIKQLGFTNLVYPGANHTRFEHSIGTLFLANKIATRLKFNEFLYLGNSEIKGKEQIRKAILADSVEAVIAAMYLDSNLEEAQRFIIDNLKNEIEVATKHVGQKDYKTVLQEKLQAHGTTSIKYEIIDEKGPDHAKIFVSQVEWNGKKLAIGEGKSKKIAEMEAARKALEILK